MFNSVIAWLEAKFPGAAAIIDPYLEQITKEHIILAVMAALHDYTSGANFLTILKDALAQFAPPPADPAA